MQLDNRLYNWIVDHQDNLFLAGLITVGLPETFLKSVLEHNRHKRKPWRGNHACVTLSFDCDYPGDVEALPQVVRCLSPYQFKASFACVGYWIEKYPREHALLVEQGHEIVNHTYSHPDNELLNPGKRFREIPREEKTEEIVRCDAICRRVLGYAPRGCRIPHFKNLFTPDIYRILGEIGYRYSSSTWLTNTRSHGMPFIADDRIIEFPLTTCPRHPFSVFDTWHSFNSPRLLYRLSHRSQERYIGLFKLLVDAACASGSYINIYIDPGDIALMTRFGKLLDYIARTGIRVATYAELAAEMNAHTLPQEAYA